MDELVWFENPGWERHVIASGLNEMINAAAADTDGDGIPEIALAYGFSMEAAKSPGIVSLLHSGADPRNRGTCAEIGPPDHLASPSLGRYRRLGEEGAGQCAAHRCEGRWLPTIAIMSP